MGGEEKNLNRRVKLTLSPPIGPLYCRVSASGCQLVPTSTRLLEYSGQSAGSKHARAHTHFFRSLIPTLSDLFFFLLHIPSTTTPIHTFAMAPKKAPAAAKENVSLGPLAGDGMSTPRLFVRSDPISLNCRSNSFCAWNRQARFRRCPHLRFLQRHLRSRH